MRRTKNAEGVAMVIGVKEAATLLGVSVDTVYRNAGGRNGIPGRKVGGQWRFRRDVLLAWMGGKSERSEGISWQTKQSSERLPAR